MGTTFAMTGGPVYGFDPVRRTWRKHDALVVEDGTIRSLDANDCGAGVPIVPLEGRAVLPAFADGHVHLTDTGLFAAEADLSNVRDVATYDRRIAALPKTRFVLAGNYDDALWDDGRANAAPLDRHHPDAIAMAVRVDGHSCVLNRRALAFVGLDPRTPGIERDDIDEPTGRLTLEANWRAQAAVLKGLPASVRRAADRRATEIALRAGALHLHVQFVGLGDRGAYRAEIAALAEAGPAQWYPKICERDPEFAAELGLPYVGGDVFLDGSIGSGTAAVTIPYCDRAGTGTLMLSDDEVLDYFSRAERLGISAGVHAIGDRAIEQCLDAWNEVLGGRPSRRCRHFIEHFEIAVPEQVELAARLGLFLSMQPQFDALWGHPGGMYDLRLGASRARRMNPLRSVVRAGATLVGGDDSPVCRLDPLEGMRAAIAHHNPDERLEIGEALAMYTWDAARFGHAEERTGRLAPGLRADCVVLEGDPLGPTGLRDVRVAETWSAGARVA